MGSMVKVLVRDLSAIENGGLKCTPDTVTEICGRYSLSALAVVDRGDHLPAASYSARWRLMRLILLGQLTLHAFASAVSHRL